MTKFELGWVAGILEGEGCFTIKSNKSYSYPSIDMQTADRDVIERLVAYTGLGSVGGPYKTRKKHHRPMYGWKMQSWPALQLMEAVLPHMSERRKERILEVIDQTS